MLTMRNQLVAVVLLHYCSNTTAQKCITSTICIYAFILCAILSVSGHIQPYETKQLILASREAPPVCWHFIHTTHPKIDNLITDARDGSILIASRGAIFKYSRQLELTSPSPLSNPNTQRINKVLTLLDEGDRLMTCGQLTDKSSLTCILHDLSNSTSTSTQQQLTWTSSQVSNSRSDIVFKSDPGEQILIHKQDASHILIVTRRGDGGFTSKQLAQVFGTAASSVARSPYYVPAVARYELTTNSQKLNMTALLPYQPRAIVGNHTVVPLYDYLYTFTFESHTYFVLNNIDTMEPAHTGGFVYEPRLARVCINDTKLTSYTEIGLVYGQLAPVGLRAKVAHLDRQDSTLHVVFEKPSEAGASGESHLCYYSMRKVQGVFNRAVKKCHNGYAPPSLLAKLHAPGSPLVCRRSSTPPQQQQQQQDSCTSTLNPYIDGHWNKSLLEPDMSLKLEGWTGANFLLSLTQGSRAGRVHFIAFNKWLIKVDSQTQEPLFTIDVANHRVGVYPLEAERNRLAPGEEEGYEENEYKKYKFSYARGYITAINIKGEIHQLPVDTCQYYTTCFSCNTVKDSLGCVWCEGKCEKQTVCGLRRSGNETATCAPSIYAFSPQAGPTSGSNTLIILGDGFGGKSSQLTVTVGGQECQIDANKSDSNKIECSVESVGEPHEAPISVIQSDNLSNGIRLEGTATSQVPYEYKLVSVFGIAQPASGPSGGGTEISIEGENLDVCRSRSVKLGETNCEISRVESSRIVCMTRALNLTPGHIKFKGEETLFQEPLRVLLDEIWPIAHRPHEDLSQVFYYQMDDSTWTWSSLLTVFNILCALVVVTPLVLLLTCLAFRKQGKQNDLPIITRTPIVCTRSLSPTNTDDSTRPNSLTGLIKLDGNNMSGNYFAPGLCENKLPDSLLSDKMRSLLGRENILIERNRLTLGHLLGAGQFARVYKGYLRPEASAGIGEYTPVAVKTLHDRSPCKKPTDDGTCGEDFLEEGLIMRDFAHENVLGLIGVAFDTKGMPMVITPFMLYGDLKSYVCDGEFSPTTKELIDFGVQIARGMAYLANLKFVHRDLAARNCMLNEQKVVKVADFGLSRDIYERDYYSSESRGAKLPVKWMAIESLGESLYSTKSDVWSYGVLLWELLAPQPGLVPYSDVDNFDILNYLRAGRRLSQPRYCPASLYRIMQACWHADPSARPTFDELVKGMSDVLTQAQVDKSEDEPVEQSEQAVEPPVASRRPSEISVPEVVKNVREQQQLDEQVEVRQCEPAEIHMQVEDNNVSHSSVTTAGEVTSPEPVHCIMKLQARQEKGHSIDLSQMSIVEQARYLGVAFDGFCFERTDLDDEATGSQE